MGNVYTNKQGLKVMEVEYGWGMDMEAIEFPLDLAMLGLWTFTKVMKNRSLLEGKIGFPELLSMASYCSDVIENAKNGETTYILSPDWEEQVGTIENAIKKLEKLH